MSNRDLQILLVDRRLVEPEHLRRALSAARGTPVTWLERLLVLGLLDEEAMCECLASACRLRRCSRAVLARVPTAIIALLPPEVAFEHRAVPIALEADGDVRVAMMDPTDLDAVREIQFFTGRRTLREVGLATDVAEALERHYGVATLLSPRVRGRAAGPTFLTPYGTQASATA